MVWKLQTHSNAKLVVKSNTCLLKFLIAKVISRRVNEFQLLGFECCIAILEHPISIFLDKMDNSSVILPIQKNANDLEVSLLNHHWDLAGGSRRIIRRDFLLPLNNFILFLRCIHVKKIIGGLGGAPWIQRR